MSIAILGGETPLGVIPLDGLDQLGELPLGCFGVKRDVGTLLVGDYSKLGKKESVGCGQNHPPDVVIQQGIPDEELLHSDVIGGVSTDD